MGTRSLSRAGSRPPAPQCLRPDRDLHRALGHCRGFAGQEHRQLGRHQEGRREKSDIRAKAVNGSKVINDSLKGADIDEDSLSGVLRCRSGLKRAVDVCYSGQRGPAAGGIAVQDCADENLRLPSAGELAVIATVESLGASTGLWTDFSYIDYAGGAARRVQTQHRGRGS